MYADLMSAFIGIFAVENFIKKVNVQIKSDMDKLMNEYIDDSYNYETLKKAPLSLGMQSDMFY